jgi:hypothetical protein
MTTMNEVREWIEDGLKMDAKFMIVGVDTFCHEDFPVYCKNRNEFWAEFNKLRSGNMTNVMECYDFSLDIETQLHEHPSWHVPF